VAEKLSFLPPLLKADDAVRKGSLKDTLTEILVADLGDQTSQAPYLIVRDMNPKVMDP
jgi:cleavage and polyadenylation specificity factor subunit 1